MDKKISFALKQERYAVIIVEDALKLMGMAMRRMPNYILMEYAQKDMLGEDLIRSIKTNPLFKDIPVIVYSFSGIKDYEDKSLKAGADRYLGKPEGCSAIIKIITEFQIKKRSQI